jgi:hypothetical protein
MQYKVIPFDPGASRDGSASYAAGQLEAAIGQAGSEGWEFVEVSNYSTIVPGSAGCFGFGATAPYPKTISMIVLRK